MNKLIKYLLIIVAFIAFNPITYAQYTSNLEFYVGTWKYTNSATNEEFTLK